MSVAAHFEPVDESRGDERGAPRFRLSLGSVIGAGQTDVLIQNISTTGLLFEADAVLAVGDTFEVLLPNMVSASVAQIVWRDGSLFGCEFETSLSQAAISAALLRSVPLMDLEDQRRQVEAKLADARGDSPATGRDSSARWLKPLAVAALIFACLGYLLTTASMFTLIVLAGSLALICVLLVACCTWALNNTPMT